MSTQPLPPPDLGLPPSKGHNVRVSVINGLAIDSRMAAKITVKPPIKGHEWLHMSAYSFLIESDNKNQKVLFDLAMMKDVDTKMAPALKALVGNIDGDVKVDKDVREQLTEQGIPLTSVNAIIWSHSHIDHVGDPSVFPPSVDLVLGPGFKSEHMPGYPTNPQGLLLDSAFEGRSVREVDFSTSDLAIGGFRAIDYFGDASFYLLEAPGHTKNHLCGLARTTENTFILFGADACHHPGQLRPSAYLPLPERISTDPSQPLSSTRGQCAFSTTKFKTLLPQSKDSEPFYHLNEILHDDLSLAEDTLGKLQVFDANDDVLVIIAHDWSLLDLIDLYPLGINQWKEHNWGELARWRFLADFRDAVA